eukprot:1790162-Pleurochrysis_carterae.AAC.2
MSPKSGYFSHLSSSEELTSGYQVASTPCSWIAGSIYQPRTFFLALDGSLMDMSLASDATSAESPTVPISDQ